MLRQYDLRSTMSLSDVNREAVLAAIQEHDRIGVDAFLRRYGFAPSREYVLTFDGRQYASKAIVGAAHGVARPDLGPLRADEFSGGDATVKRRLERLGFVLQR